jgi:hypothetical protein
LKDIDPEHWEKLHTLEEVVYTEPCMDSYPSPKPLYGSVNEPECIIQKKDGHHYMHIDIISNHSKNCSSTARMITFQLTCPYLFGDDNIHEIETYWIQENQGRVGYSKCYRIVMGDRDITSIVYEGKGVNVESVATITLDK